MSKRHGASKEKSRHWEERHTMSQQPSSEQPRSFQSSGGQRVPPRLQKPKKPILVALIVIGSLIILIGILCILPLSISQHLSGQAAATPTLNTSISPTSANTLIVNSTLLTLKIEADIPPMEVKHQVIVAIAIYPTGGNGVVSEVPVVKNATPIVTNATPVGTPGSTLVDAFGPNHSVVATATFETSPDIFSVAPTGPQTKPLDQERVEWDWFVTPLVDGDQSIGVDIEAQWTSTISGKQSLPYTLGFPRFPVHVQALPVVPTPTPTPPPPGPLDILSALAPIIAAMITTVGALTAAFFAVPSFRRWVGVRLRRSKKKSPTEPETPS